MKNIFLLAAFAALALTATSVSAKTENVTVQGSKGKLAAILQTPDNIQQGQKCPIVILCHGFNGSKDNERGMMFEIAKSLEAQGVATIRFDFNGHGQSEGKFSEMTVLNEIEDAKAVYEYAAALPYVSSISILGHSQGGVVASMTAGELGAEKIASVALLAPAVCLRDDAIRGNTFGKIYDPINPPAEIELFPGLCLGGEYVRQARNLKIYETACQFTGPVCLVHGTDDRIAPYSYSETFNREYKQSEIHLLDNDDHGFSKHFGEMVSIVTGFFAK